ncbi:SDR family NAD(P)-dependent oxidoreductase [Paraflavitalea pollutisoli]|uniref:SDR family NAD(P)-dependent oxidoreductase n=1 Tax=Paraflavitalea pollutisoli TaxID=3034143 RepID=UPI0023EB9D8F|nr:SDR family NAD(P)-dependent oxidoreductase [Paraflavitalea sp. H1-2-19X]
MKKIALVTGASRGLGWELTHQLTTQGHFVLMGVRDRRQATAAWERLPARELAQTIELDMTNPLSFPWVYEHIERTYGHLDILVNNAGVMLDGELSNNSATTIERDDLKKTFEVNFFGIVELTNTLVPLLLKSEAASIINLSSNMGSLHLLATQPAMPKTFAYNTSKAALNSYTLHLASLLSDTKVRVNAVHPGWAQTDMGGPTAPLTAAEAVAPIVDLIAQGVYAPTGKFLHKGEEVNW